MRYFEKNRLTDVAGDRINPSTNEMLRQVYGAVSALRGAVGTAADLRVTLLSGVVTTVTTVTGITNLGGQPAINIVSNIGNTLYSLAHTNNIGA
jgi:hypothetical protein